MQDSAPHPPPNFVYHSFGGVEKKIPDTNVHCLSSQENPGVASCGAVEDADNAVMGLILYALRPSCPACHEANMNTPPIDGLKATEVTRSEMTRVAGQKLTQLVEEIRARTRNATTIPNTIFCPCCGWEVHLLLTTVTYHCEKCVLTMAYPTITSWIPEDLRRIALRRCIRKGLHG